MDKKLEIKVREFVKQVRLTQMEMFRTLGFGHIGGALSATDIIGLLYEGVMKYKPEDPAWEGRDRLVCSKGHAGPAVYSALALKGFFPMDWIHTLNQGGTNLPSHCDMNRTPGIDMTTGSLGQGGSAALGMAMGLKETGQKVFLIMGDGECNEGQVWEMALSAAHHKVNNLIAFVDYNHKQLDGVTDDILNMGNIAGKFESFGWYSREVNGHDVAEIYDTLKEAEGKAEERPVMIVLNTVKGKGVKFIEEIEFNHHIMISREDADRALEEIRSEVVQ